MMSILLIWIIVKINFVMKYLVLVDNLKGFKEQFIVNESDVQMFLIDHLNCVCVFQTCPSEYIDTTKN